jgi:hypothetical protein
MSTYAEGFIEGVAQGRAEGQAEIVRLRDLLYRCRVAWVEDDSDLAAEVRAALEGK